MKVWKLIAGILVFFFYLWLAFPLMVPFLRGQDPCPDDMDTWSEAVRTPGIIMSDSDFWDDNGNGIWDEGDEELMPDKLSDIEEYYIYGTNVSNPDTDADGMLDGWEVFYMVEDPVTGNRTIDPNVPDGGANPDGDGLDLDRNGVLDAHLSKAPEWDGGENFTNLEEYCGGSIESMIGDAGLLLTPEREELLREIASEGGFHLCLNFINPHTNRNFSYEEYNPWQQRHSKTPLYVSTDPSDYDTDNDGMGDYYEIYNGGRERPDSSWGGAEAWHGESVYVYNDTIGNYEQFTYPFSLDPLDPTDAEEDMDLASICPYSHVPLGGDKRVEPAFVGKMEYRRDGLTNLEEYIYGTDPMNWDTDGDTFERPDGSELDFCDGWERGNCSFLNPTNPDTDGDGMWDAWECYYGFNPLNASDRFCDLDDDGLGNADEINLGTDPLDPDTDDDGCGDRDDSYPLDPDIQ